MIMPWLLFMSIPSEDCVTKVELATTNTSLTEWLPQFIFTQIRSKLLTNFPPNWLSDSSSRFAVIPSSCPPWITMTSVQYLMVMLTAFTHQRLCTSSNLIVPSFYKTNLHYPLRSRPTLLPSCLSNWRSKLVENPIFHKQEVLPLFRISIP